MVHDGGTMVHDGGTIVHDGGTMVHDGELGPKNLHLQPVMNMVKIDRILTILGPKFSHGPALSNGTNKSQIRETFLPHLCK